MSQLLDGSLTLTVVRDEYEVKIPELEANLSAVCGVPWRLQIDPAYVYSFAEDDFSKKYPGRMITKYVEEGTKKIKEYINKYGDDGTTELNKLASAHSVTLEPVTTQPINYCGCEISGGCLRLLFKKGMLGTNISDACSELAKAINTAGAAAPGASVLDFNAKQSIKSDYEPKIGEVQAKIQQTLALPVLTLHPNFEENYALLDAFAKSGQADSMWPKEWQKAFGSHTLMYFNAVLKSVENAGFGKDDMLQEGFQEAVEKNEISLKVVQKLEKSNYNEPVIKNSVLYIQTTPAMWTTNIRDCADKLIDLL